MTMACRASSTTTLHCCGKKRPTLAAPSAGSFSGTPRFNISGQIFEAPKFEKRNHRSSGLALTAFLAQGHPTAETASARTIIARKARRMTSPTEGREAYTKRGRPRFSPIDVRRSQVFKTAKECRLRLSFRRRRLLGARIRGQPERVLSAEA